MSKQISFRFTSLPPGGLKKWTQDVVDHIVHFLLFFCVLRRLSLLPSSVQNDPPHITWPERGEGGEGVRLLRMDSLLTALNPPHARKLLSYDTTTTISPTHYCRDWGPPHHRSPPPPPPRQLKRGNNNK